MEHHLLLQSIYSDPSFILEVGGLLTCFLYFWFHLISNSLHGVVVDQRDAGLRTERLSQLVLFRKEAGTVKRDNATQLRQKRRLARVAPAKKPARLKTNNVLVLSRKLYVGSGSPVRIPLESFHSINRNFRVGASMKGDSLLTKQTA